MTDVFIEVEKVNDVEIVLTAVTGGVLPDGIVENTDDSYSDTVANGSTLIIPDINITKNDDSVVTSPSAIDLDLRIIDPVTTPSGWDEQVAEYGRGYSFPMPSGQTIVYRTGDDADIETTIFAPVRVANSLKVQNSLVDFLTLGNTNSFGNTVRFTNSIGGVLWDSSDGSIQNYRIDNYTGLAQYLLEFTNFSWDEKVDTAINSNILGFSDWFFPNINILHSIQNYEEGFNGYAHNGILSSGLIGNSSTNSSKTTDTWYEASGYRVLGVAKTNTAITMFMFRKHF